MSPATYNNGQKKTALNAGIDALHELHWKAAAERDPVEAARAAGCIWNNGIFILEFLGRKINVDLEKRSIRYVDDSERQVSFQRGLTVLSYLANAMECEPSGKWVAFRELKGGEAFFRGPHKINTSDLEATFGNDPEAFKKASLRLGGVEADGADAAFMIPAFERIPLKVLLWKKTAEFAASATMLIDSRAALHLKLDVLWALSNLAVADLVRGV